MPPEEELSDVSFEALQEQLNNIRDRLAVNPSDTNLIREYVDLRYIEEINVVGSDYARSDQGFQDLVEAIRSELPGVRNVDFQTVALKRLQDLAASRTVPRSAPVRRQMQRESDPVQMFNGEFVHQEEDLRVNGAGIDFVFRRTYRNQVVFSGPLGANWDHAYNLHLLASGNDLVLATGELREQRYTRHPTHDYFVPPDGVDATIEAVGETFVRRAPDGVRHIFEPDPSFAGVHRLARIEDRFDNFLHFLYRDDVDRLLEQVLVNHPRRAVRIAYDVRGRIVRVTDYTERAWQYTYDDLDDLVAVTTPATDHHPHGLTTCFEYRTAFTSGLLQHNLARVIDASGGLYLENEYGEAPGEIGFNRVVRQRQGAGETLFEYSNVTPVVDREYGEAQRPAHQTLMTDRNGQVIHRVYNRFGNLLLREECISDGGLPRILIARYRYNRDGQLVASLSPEGVLTQYLFGREHFMRRNGLTDEDEVAIHETLTASERRAFGRLIAVVRRGRYFTFSDLDMAQAIWGDFPDIIAGFDPDAKDIIVKRTYEPDYGQPLTVSDPRFTNNADPDAVNEDPRHQETLTEYVYEGPSSDPNRFLVEIVRPGPASPDGTVSPRIVEEFRNADGTPGYDDRGRLLRHQRPGGAVKEYAYFADGEADTGPHEGYLRRTVVDPGGLAITTEYDVDELGRVVSTKLPRSLGVNDGRFVNRTSYDALDQVTETFTSDPFRFRTRRFYDQNGNLEREERELKDENGQEVLGGWEVRTFCHDEEWHLVRETIGGTDLSAHLMTKHRYDSAGQRVLTILPEGNLLGLRYDERLLPVSITMGVGTEDAATNRTEYDGDGRIRRTRDARGNPNSFEFDPFGRVTSEENALGHITMSTYDKASNLTCTRAFERRADGYYLSARTETEYDVLNRAIRTGANRFDDPPGPFQRDELQMALLESPGSGELLVTRTFYDADGRVVRTTDPLQRERTYEYDPADRMVLEVDPLGNQVLRHYDPHGNMVRQDQVDLVRDPDSGTVIGQRAFASSSTFDELDRLTESTDSLGNTTRYFYDSRGNLVAQVDALGNVTQTTYDLFNRRVATQRQLTGNGLGDGPGLSVETTRFEYDRNGNLVSIVDALERPTRSRYDALDRLREITYVDESTLTYDYDRDGHLLRFRDNNGLQRLSTIDALGRTTRVDVDGSGLPPGLTVEGATFEEYAYDALDRRIREENDFARLETQFNSLGWPVSETMTPTGAPAPLASSTVVVREFNSMGALTGLLYPSGRRVRFRRDALDRLVGMENLANGLAYPGSSSTPDAYEIARMLYAGRQRGQCLFGNGALIRYSHDGAARLIEIAHAAGAGELLTIQYLFDAVGNVRARHEIGPSENVAEEYSYDSVYRLAHQASSARSPFDPTTFAPAATVLPDPIPNRQAALDALITSLALPPGARTFDYDLVGNRERENLADGNIAYTVNPLNQYTSRDGTTFTYDDNGNLRSDGTRTYSYDSLNRLVRVVDATSTADIAQFFHDARGRRILEVMEGVATQLVWEEDDVVAEYRDGMPSALYAYEDGLDRAIQIATQGEEYWYHTDLAGSIRLLTDADGTQAARYRFTPFGAQQEQASSGPHNPLRYTARRLNPTTGTYDCRAREYAPHLGRFLQRDPLKAPDDTNPYAYVGNNPLVFTDPLGTKRLEKAGGSGSPQWLRLPPAQPPIEPGTQAPGEQYTHEDKWGVWEHIKDTAPELIPVDSEGQPFTPDEVRMEEMLLWVDGDPRFQGVITRVRQVENLRWRQETLSQIPTKGEITEMVLGMVVPTSWQDLALMGIGLGVGAALAGVSKLARGAWGARKAAKAARLGRAIDEEIEVAVESATSTNLYSLPGRKEGAVEGLIDVTVKRDPSKPIWYHDILEFRKVGGAPKPRVQVRTHSPNPKAPAGTYSRSSPTTQITTKDNKSYRLPDGTWKKFNKMTSEEKAAAHYP